MLGLDAPDYTTVPALTGHNTVAIQYLRFIFLPKQKQRDSFEQFMNEFQDFGILLNKFLQYNI